VLSASQEKTSYANKKLDFAQAFDSVFGSTRHSIRYLGSTYLLELLQRLAFLGEMARLDLVVAPHRIVSNPPEQ
jgi:hypothetical protein